MTYRACAIAFLAVAVASAGGSVHGQDLARPSTAHGEWPTYSGDLVGTKYVDAKTGKPCPNFGVNGRVDLVDGKQHIALTVQGARQSDVPELIALALP